MQEVFFRREGTADTVRMCSRDCCGWTTWLPKLVLLLAAFSCRLHQRTLWAQCWVTRGPWGACGPCAVLQLGSLLPAPVWSGLHLQQVSVSHAQLS